MWLKNPFDEVESVSDDVCEVYKLRTVDERRREGAYLSKQGKGREIEERNRGYLASDA